MAAGDVARYEARMLGYLLAAMLTWAPLEAHDYTKIPRDVTRARYESIARDLEVVVTDPLEAPLFDGPTGRAQTAVLMLAIASYESGQFRADVDREDRPTGDGGAAWCLGQLHAPYSDGLTDRVSCFRGMLRALRDSSAMCGTEDVARRFSGYTVGVCLDGEAKAQHRVTRARAWWAVAPWLPPVD